MDRGRRFVSYRAIEEAWLDDILATMEDGVGCFMVEAAWVLRHYLERHPEHANALRGYAQAGRFELLGSGENIIDVNMVHGELMARNLILGTLWGEHVLGVRPTTGWHGDGFGSSAQMPQVLRECGYQWIPAISYSHPDAPYWRGLDGATVLFNIPERFTETSGSHASCFRKHPPCPACQGHGCAICQDRGFDPNRAELDNPPMARTAAAAIVCGLWGEEILPGERVTAAIAALNATNGELHFRHGVYRDLYPFLAQELAQVDAPPAELVSSRVENNPTQCGCWVSRIRCKQEHRKTEHLVLAAEVWDTLLNAGAQADTLRTLWKTLTFSAFHDAITATHIDAAHEELMDLLGAVQHTATQLLSDACTRHVDHAITSVTLFNHHAFPSSAPVTVTVPGDWAGARVTAGDMALPVFETLNDGEVTLVTFAAPSVPGLGATTVTLSPAPARQTPVHDHTITHAGYTIDAGEHGITRIAVEELGAVVDGRDFLFGELVLEVDEGDPWGTRTYNHDRERCAPFTTLTGIEALGDSVVLRYAGAHPVNFQPFSLNAKITYLDWTQNFILRTGIPWLEVETTVGWYTQDYRLRLAFPSATRANRGVYEIPYGVLERDRYEATGTHLGAANGDWPAIHWAGIQTPGYTFAVFNQGTPSYRVEDGTVLVSVLRSPVAPCCLLEPASYVAHNYYGMMDNGTHTFHHALYLGAGDWRDNAVVRQAAIFNCGLTVVPGALSSSLPEWKLQAAHTLLSTIKPAEDGRGIVVRLVEHAGRPEIVRLRVPATLTSAVTANLLEDPLVPLTRDGDDLLVPMGAWKIVTVRIA